MEVQNVHFSSILEKEFKMFGVTFLGSDMDGSISFLVL
jgi:hypothetical protein